MNNPHFAFVTVERAHALAVYALSITKHPGLRDRKLDVAREALDEIRQLMARYLNRTERPEQEQAAA